MNPFFQPTHPLERMEEPVRPPSLEMASRRERRWAVVRFVSGTLQMFGASLGVLLLLRYGVQTPTLLVVLLTSICTTVSVMLFGRRR